MSPLAWMDFSNWLAGAKALRQAVIVLLALALLTLLAACGTPQPLASAPAKAPRVIAVATLATNSCELQTAPTYTAAITAARVAEARVRAGTLPLSRAQLLLDLGRYAQADLDAACPGKQLDAERLRRAQEAVSAMQSILKE